MDTSTPPVSFKIGFVNPDSRKKYLGMGLHETLARDICKEENYDWESSNYFSAVDYLLEEKGFIKVANYGYPHNYVALVKPYSNEAANIAALIALKYHLRVEAYSKIS